MYALWKPKIAKLAKARHLIHLIREWILSLQYPNQEKQSLVLPDLKANIMNCAV